LNLIELYADGNSKITNINHMTNLKILSAQSPSCGIDNNGIKDLNLIKLFTYYNPKMTKNMINELKNKGCKIYS
jgi:hypothetical protein